MVDLIPDDPDTQLTRDGLATALTAAGFPTPEATLATKATRGGGPPYRKYGNRAIYRWGDALAWAQSRLGPLIRSTSEADAVLPALVRAVEHAGDLRSACTSTEILTRRPGHRTASSDGPATTAPGRRVRSCPEEPAAG